MGTGVVIERACPSEKLPPLSTTSMSSFFAASSAMCFRPTCSSADHTAASSCSSNGSRLLRIVPANMNGSDEGVCPYEATSGWS
eukprot:30708-Pelagococcus_subviridis.AAC.4